MRALPDQVGMASRTDEDPEGGELAQLMRSLGDGAEGGAAVRYEKGDKVTHCTLANNITDCSPVV